MQIDFYHLTGSPVERVLPRIAERILQEQGRLLVVAPDDALAARLDAQFWNYRPESFLPHGRAGQEGEDQQPVLIAPGCTAANAARNVALADGEWREEALGFDRAFLLFGDDRIAAARDLWRKLGDVADVDRRFWKQDPDGKWARQA